MPSKKNLNILLIEPRHKDVTRGLPLGMAYLAAVLRERKKNGYKVSVLDSNVENLNHIEVVNKIRDIEVDIVGIGATTVQIKEAWRIFEYLKKVRPNIITLLGGIHPTALPEESLEKPYIDFVLRGECENSILEFMKAIKTKEFNKVRGLSYKKKIKGKIKFYHNEKPPLIEDLDKLPFPARDLFSGFPEKYSSEIQRSKNKADILTSRGCPGACNFCNKTIHGFKFRVRSPENVVEEIEYLYKKFNIDDFYILDDYFTADMARIEKICDLILEKNLKINWVCANGVRVDNINLRVFKKMKKAGCYRIAFGVESGNEEILKKIGKNIKLEQVKKAFEIAQKVGFITIAYFMIGNMWENEETINKTIEFSKSLKTDYAQFLIVRPYPGSALYELIKRGVCNAKLSTEDWEEYNVFGSKSGFTTDTLSEELLTKMYKKAYHSFYFRPKQILFILYKRIITGRLELMQLLNLIKYFFTKRR